MRGEIDRVGQRIQFPASVFRDGTDGVAQPDLSVCGRRDFQDLGNLQRQIARRDPNFELPVFGADDFPDLRDCEALVWGGVAAGAAWLWVVLPDAWHVPIAEMWETSLAALFLALLFWATLALRGERSVAKWAGYGALWAVGALINTSLISVLPFFLAWLAWEAHKERMPWLRCAAIAGLVFVLGMAPWTIRNYRVFGKFVPVRSNFGLELWLGNNPAALEVNAFQLHPLVNRAEADNYQRMGEIAYMRAKQHAALAFMHARPATTCYFILRRIGANWFAVSDRVGTVLSTGSLYLKAYFFFNAAMTLLAWFGAAVAWRARNLYRAPYLLVLFAYPLVFYVTHALVRYRFPMEPILAILAIYGASRALARRRLPMGAAHSHAIPSHG